MTTTKTKQKKPLPFSKWQVTITFVPFKSARQRDMVYKVWIETWLKGEKNKLAKKQFEKKLGQELGM